MNVVPGNVPSGSILDCYLTSYNVL